MKSGHQVRGQSTAIGVDEVDVVVEQAIRHNRNPPATGGYDPLTIVSQRVEPHCHTTVRWRKCRAKMAVNRTEMCVIDRGSAKGVGSSSMHKQCPLASKTRGVPH